MASTTSCNTCGKEVSTEAKTCPHCGQPDPAACFPSSTLVLTPTGWRKIALFEVGDHVLSYNSQSSCLVVRPVTKRVDHPSAEIWNIFTENSTEPISTTAIHPFFSKRGWVQAKRLRPGDELLAVRSICGFSSSRILSVVKTSRIEPVHNLYTAGEHTFIVYGYLAHNFANFRVLRTWLHRLFIDPSSKVDISRSNWEIKCPEWKILV